MSTVGFIGLGTMGRHMARNLIRAGHRLVFYARRPEVIAEFEQLGGTLASNGGNALCGSVCWVNRLYLASQYSAN